MTNPRPSAETEVLWFYTDAQNQPVGPVPFSELQRLAAAGFVGPHTHVIEEGGVEWKVFGLVAPTIEPSPPLAVSTPPQKPPPRRWPTILALVLFYPVGLLLLWRTRAFTSKTKKILAATFLPLFLIAIFSRHSEGSGKAPPKVGERRRLAPNSWVFADEKAYTDYTAAKTANDTAKLAELNKSNRAFLLRKGGFSVWIVRVNGPAGLVQTRSWMKDHSRSLLWTSPDNALPEAPPKTFQIGEEVEIPKDTPLYTNTDLIRAYRKASADDNEAKAKELGPQLDADIMRLPEKARAKVIQTDDSEHLYKVEGTLSDGSPLRRWAIARFLEPYGAAVKPATESTKAALAQGALIMARTTLYADDETLRTIKTEWDKGELEGKEASERLRNAGKMWTEDYHIAAKVLRDGGPMDSVLVEAKEPRGLKASRFWVLKPLVPLDRPFAQRAMRKEFMRRKSDFVFTFTGNNGTEVSGADVGNLAEMVEGIYRGQIPVREASRYLFRMEAIEAELVRVAGEYLIYETVVHPRRHYEFAMRRDPALEREVQKDYGGLDAFYEDIRRSQFHSDSPLTQGPIMVVGTEQFTTGAGLVKVVPVVQVVNLTP